MIELNEENFESELNDCPRAVVDFWASWCSPCRMQAPVLEQFENQSSVKVFKVNVDSCSDIARKFGVSNIPTLIVFEKGKEVKRAVGFNTLEQINKLVT